MSRRDLRLASGVQPAVLADLNIDETDEVARSVATLASLDRIKAVFDA